MTNNSRTKNVLINTLVGIAGQLLNLILNFASRTIFINILGVTYLGVNGLFSNIFSILSLVELGIGSAIVFSLYKPLAEKNNKKLEALMGLYEKAYRVVGISILLLGIIIIPFLEFFIKEDIDIPHLKLIFSLFLINTAVTYFIAFKRSIFIADQKNYINTLNNNVFSFITKIVQIAVLVITENFILYLIVQIILVLLSNIEISIRANKHYPFLKNKTGAKLSKEDLKEIKKNISSMFLLRIGDVVVNGTNNLLISTFIGIVWVGIYSNYLMLINIIQSFISQIFNSMTASVGNLVNLEDKEKSLDIFYKIFFVNFIIYGFSSICLFILVNPFIELWIGKDFLLSTKVVFLIVLSNYLMGIRNVLWVYINALGLFYHFRYMPFLECAINLGASILLINKFGISGVFLGTIISTLTTYFIAEPYILNRHFNKLPLKRYFIRYFFYLGIMVVTGGITWTAISIIKYNTWLGFILKVIISILIITFTFIIAFYRTKEYKYFISILITFFIKIRERRTTDKSMSNY